LSVSLIQHKRIRTTTAKAKEARTVVEKLITRAKRAVLKEADGKPKDVHARRQVFAFLRDRSAVSTLFNDIAPKVNSRPGGYTRVVKLGQRHGDGAEVAILELVDFNTGQEKSATKAKSKATTTRKKTEKKQKSETATTGASESAPPKAEADSSSTHSVAKSGEEKKESESNKESA
jgi:large subunit ribosomal protein L17